MKIFRKAIAMLLMLFQLFFSNTVYGEWGDAEIPSEIVAPSERDISEHSNLSLSVKLAAEQQNSVQGFFTDGERSAYTLKNSGITLTHELSKFNGKSASLKNSEGGLYAENLMDPFYVSRGITHYASASQADGRVNTIRMGLYVYESHVRDLDFSLGSNFKVDKGYHVYADRLYQETRLYAEKSVSTPESFGWRTRIPVQSVAGWVQTNEYAAFDIKNVGIIGFILPGIESCGVLEIEKTAGYFIITQTADFEQSTMGELEYLTLGCRVYTDETHDFAGVARASFEERNPLTVEVIGGNANARSAGYEPLRGSYLVELSGTDFQTAYDNPDRRFSAGLRVSGDAQGRSIVMRATADSGGSLEAGAVLDNAGKLAAIPVQVCKNFNGDSGEPFYSQADIAYGDAFFPLRIESEEAVELTALHIYQNWGKVPIKQLSSIEFFVSYYHLSTGTTESNCIAPYGVYGRDGWILPDFRSRSGIMWSSQPQFNSVGRLYFMRHNESLSKQRLGEYQSSLIKSVGMAYSDIITEYTAENGAYDYSLRHVEFPQTDENRTMYSLSVTFNRDVSFKNFRRDMELFTFDGRFMSFTKAGYLDSENQPQTQTLNSRGGTQYISLGGDRPYFGYYSIEPSDFEENAQKNFGANFALIVNDSSITVGGEEYTGNFAFKNSFEDGLNVGSLTLDEKSISFKAGDEINIDFVLLPWGIGNETEDSTVREVRQEEPLRAVAAVGTVIDDAWLPVIQADGNRAQFTISGGKNNVAVEIRGLETPECPLIEENIGGEWQAVKLASSNGDDGYSLTYDRVTGLYSLSFVITTDGGARMFRASMANES